MKLFTFFAFLALPALASDFTGIYARIDRVVLEPSTGTPERVQVWGVFAIAKTTNPNDYDAPRAAMSTSSSIATPTPPARRGTT